MGFLDELLDLSIAYSLKENAETSKNEVATQMSKSAEDRDAYKFEFEDTTTNSRQKAIGSARNAFKDSSSFDTLSDGISLVEDAVNNGNGIYFSAGDGTSSDTSFNADEFADRYMNAYNSKMDYSEEQGFNKAVGAGSKSGSIKQNVLNPSHGNVQSVAENTVMKAYSAKVRQGKNKVRAIKNFNRMI